MLAGTETAAPHLRHETEALLVRKRAGHAVDLQHDRMRFLPDHQVLERLRRRCHRAPRPSRAQVCASKRKIQPQSISFTLVTAAQGVAGQLFSGPRFLCPKGLLAPSLSLPQASLLAELPVVFSCF